MTTKPKGSSPNWFGLKQSLEQISAICRKGQGDTKIHMEIQGTQNTQIILKKKNKAEGFTLPNWKT